MITHSQVRRLLRKVRRGRGVRVLVGTIFVMTITVVITPPSWQLLVLSNTLKTVNDIRDTILRTTPLPWQPEMSKLLHFYRYLNMSQSQQSMPLPVTLEGKFLLNNLDLCSSGEESMDSVDVLFMVHTALLNFRQREALRSTVANQSFFYPFKVRILFLLGLPANDTNGTVQSLIELEHKKYGDTLQGDFIDTYSNLTHKGVMGYRWITQYCPHVRLVAKIDDDVFVDTFKLLHRFWPVLFVAKSRAIFCNVWHNNTMPILREGKWKITENVMRNLKYFPWDYCSGMAVFITGDLIPFLYRAAFRTPFFWIDDAYLFGMLPGVVGNVTYYDIGFSKNLSLNHDVGFKCMKTQGITCPFVAVGSKLETFPEMWNVTYNIHRGLWKLETKTIS
ncbi:hypothetical protein C0Q70_09866 [Pomacea canaliculata]|uniref:Hexosyltransferase n=1 Tax=Pomacea canaliculata TaxID=400727 RepID=A0A2T7PAZ1_POMCA|nr:UDP-GalNAc:beta-1,3-N-acetylgalactosaminyltransferase 1-like isoform X2 [Pomacea canaliculata]XP_025095010.1 UDP-GalNAc:beta-1,3-N-acetylgalactosaminyltransferase 1-like isoform X2 [Pomacea canaliculata]XP_025095012.1 UDP-GalNAc:beta-1,3-N-acetylgalactosaminyltransferase 1-like isoform X2 [Pomacea canaliculata]PVD30594.1 hypothetical protein C0Q70_09866 [Pomacea canaliculata]